MACPSSPPLAAPALLALLAFAPAAHAQGDDIAPNPPKSAPDVTQVAPPPANATPPSPAPAPVSPAATPEQIPSGHFEFGSYGRVRVASDLRGGTGRQANVVGHGSRIDEDSYAEMELRREDVFSPIIKSKVVATIAFFPPFFHFSGDPKQQIAMRNLYAQATYQRFTMWAGSRMYRGDDIYLLDWWPLDNQNTVGGGLGYTFPDDDTTVAAHFGMQRLDDLFQHQEIDAVVPFGVGSTKITKLDRPRAVETLKATHLFRHMRGLPPKGGFKVILYGEAHELAAGTYQDPLIANTDRPLPPDSGFLIGAQLGFWTGERDTHVNLFLRHARGVAAYDPLAVPSSFANDRTTSGSTETLAALGANYEVGAFGILAAGYVRAFRDADPSPTSTQKYDEGNVVLRPQVFLGENFGIAFEGSFQEKRLAILDPSTNAPLTAAVLRGGLIPFFSPSGRGSYKRPQLRIIYAVTARDAGARALYPSADVYATRKAEHFLGLGAEWWFNSSSYP